MESVASLSTLIIRQFNVTSVIFGSISNAMGLIVMTMPFLQIPPDKWFCTKCVNEILP